MLMNNDGRHINKIMNATKCATHRAELGEACWDIYPSSSTLFTSAVCGRRIKTQGFNGKISEVSLSTRGGPRRGNTGRS